MTSLPRPRIAVLCTAEDRPPGLAGLGDRVDFVFADTDSLGTAVEGAQGLLLWDFFSGAVRDVWDHCGDLEWIHVAAAGVDRLMFDELRGSAVTVTNAHGIFNRPIAEFVLASVLAHAKQLHRSMDLQRHRNWEHRETAELSGSRALIVGTGGIGTEIARLLSLLGVHVALAGSSQRVDADWGTILDSAELSTHLAGVDYLINAAPLTDQTRGLFDAQVFAALDPTAYFVNIGRGASVVEDDLIAALQSNQFAGAALDVVASEPLPDNSPLWTLPQVAVSAHMSGDVVGWKQSLANQFIALAERWLDGGQLSPVVDKKRGYVASH